MTQDSSPTIGYAIWRLSTKVRTLVDAALLPIDLTHAQYVVLSSLWGMTRSGEKPSQRQLADHTALDPVYISKIIRTLEAAQLVVRVPDLRDNRAVRLHLTTEGEQLAEHAISIVYKLMTEFMTPLGGDASPRSRQFAANLEILLESSI